MSNLDPAPVLAESPTSAPPSRLWERVAEALASLVGEPVRLTAESPSETCAAAPVLCFNRPAGALLAPASADPARLAAGAHLAGALLEAEATAANLAQHVAQLWRELNFILAAERDLAVPLDVPAAALALLDPILDTVGARRGSIYVARGGALEPVAARGVPASFLAPIAIDDAESIAAWVYRHGAPLLINDAARRPPALRARRFPLPDGDRDAFLAIPLLLPDAERTPVGVLHLAGKAAGHFHAGEVKLATAAAQMVAVAVHRSRLTAEALAGACLREELRLAAEMHAELLPAALPDVPGLELAAAMRPTGAVSGDYYDFVTRADGIDLMIADVQGHGLAAALLVGTVRTALRSALREGLGPGAALARLNHVLLDATGESGVFATAAVARLAGARVTFAAAGHPPLLLAGDGPPRKVSGSGPPAGAVGGATYAETEAELGPNGILALYTDGLLGNGGRGTVDRLLAALASAAAAPGARTAGIAAELMDAVEGPEDDRTVVVARRTGGSA